MPLAPQPNTKPPNQSTQAVIASNKPTTLLPLPWPRRAVAVLIWSCGCGPTACPSGTPGKQCKRSGESAAWEPKPGLITRACGHGWPTVAHQAVSSVVNGLSAFKPVRPPRSLRGQSIEVLRNQRPKPISPISARKNHVVSPKGMPTIKTVSSMTNAVSMVKSTLNESAGACCG